MGNRHGGGNKRQNHPKNNPRNNDDAKIQKEWRDDKRKIEEIQSKNKNMKKENEDLLRPFDARDGTSFAETVKTMENDTNNVTATIAKKTDEIDSLNQDITRVEEVIRQQQMQINTYKNSLAMAETQKKSIYAEIELTQNHSSNAINLGSIQEGFRVNCADKTSPLDGQTVEIKKTIYNNVKNQNEYLYTNTDFMKKDIDKRNGENFYEEQTNSMYGYLNVFMLLLYCILFGYLLFILYSAGVVMENIGIVAVMCFLPFFVSIWV